MNILKDYCAFCMEQVSEGTSCCPHCKKETQAATLPHQLLPGTVLANKFLVGAVLGEGGFGITYIGRDVNLDMRVAIKEYYPSGFVNRNHTYSEKVTAHTGEPESAFEKGKDRFLKEARILAKFSGETGIVGVRDFFTENNTAYIIMDYLDGITLKAWIEQNGKMQINQVLDLMKPVMTALSRIHEQGLIHRDISPDNIMLMNDGSLKLLDFGAARDMSGIDEKSLSIMLKPGYAPEEQYRSKGKQGAWTDVYALCATIYKCITGITPEDAMQRVFSDDETKAPSTIGADISGEQEAALLKGMAVLQKNRFQSIAELWEAFFGSTAPVTQGTSVAAVSRAAVASDNGNRTVYAEEADISKANRTVMATEEKPSFVPAPKIEPQAPVMPSPVYDVVPPVTPINNPQSMPKKKNKLPKVLGIIGAGFAALLVIVVIWNMLGSMNDIRIGDKTIKRKDSEVSFIKAPEKSELEQLKDMPNLHYVSLNYADGLDNETLAIIGQLTNLTKLQIGPTSPSLTGYTPTLDLNLIKNLKNLTTLDIYYLAGLDLTPVSELVNLDSLKICYSPTIDFRAISTLPKLKYLTIRQSAEDISTLAGISTLDEINLSENKISDISSLKGCTALKNLYIDYNQISDISVVSNFNELRCFYASNNQIADITPLSACKKLNAVDLDKNKVTDISSLSACKKTLELLSINDNNVDDLTALTQSIYLEEISAANNKIVSLAGLANTTQLKKVNFNNNQISDISVLAKSAAKLETLMLENNKVEDISALKGTAALTLLAMDGNMIDDVEPLRQSVKLERLFLHGNSIASISALSGLTELDYLDLSNNQIENISALSGLNPSSRLGNMGLNVDLSNNKITDISPLPKNDGSEKQKSGRDGYVSLHLYGNPIKNLSRLKGFKIGALSFTYYDDADYSPLGEIESKIGQVFYSIDTPLDKQADFNSNYGQNMGSRFLNFVKFVSTEEIDAFKQEKRDAVTGANKDENAEDLSGTTSEVEGSNG